MKKRIPLITMLLLFTLLGIGGTAEARKGQASSDYESTSSSESSSYSRAAKSNSALAKAAKTKKAKSAWRDYLKKNQQSAPVSLQKDSPNLATQVPDFKSHDQTDKLAAHLSVIERQIADAKRQQQLIAIAQTAAQALMNKQRQSSNTNFSRFEPAIPAPAATPATLSREKSNPVSGGISWGLIFFIVAGIVVLIIWRSNSHSGPVTNYRL